jgi:carboxypeptidase D
MSSSNGIPSSQTTLAALDAQAEKCGYTGYIEKYVTYPPPKGPFPVLPVPEGCDIWGAVFEAALAINPAFNVYRIFDTVRARIQISSGFSY